MNICFVVTNDLIYDQRMIRIATSVTRAGYSTRLVGRKLANSAPLSPQPFHQKRIFCFFKKGKLFYMEYNIRVFFYLLFSRTGCICAIDLDTILPCYFISKIKGIPRVYDAHELFCEMKEIVSRPRIYRLWKRVEKFAVPRFPNGYTVSRSIKDEFNTLYCVDYAIIRNISLYQDIHIPEKKIKYVLYQGAVNEGRSFETIIPAMKFVDAPLVICGNGNFMQQAKTLVLENGLSDKITFKGYVLPKDLREYTMDAWIGINLVDDSGFNNYYSLTNRFFDYMHAGLPQLCVDIPACREINSEFEIAILISDLSAENIARHINILFEDTLLYQRLQANCILAREVFNWQNEETKLIRFYKHLLG